MSIFVITIAKSPAEAEAMRAETQARIDALEKQRSEMTQADRKAMFQKMLKELRRKESPPDMTPAPNSLKKST